MLLPKGLMFAPVQNLDEVLVDPQALANDYVIDFDHPHLGNVKLPGFPIHFSANSAGTHSPAPGLGEHTDQVLDDMGYSQDQISRLKQENIIK
jgi:crotonobetainyl-CoA:carnitine CoA-transferase CaiB-like acyl-CoA transferase